MAGEEDRKWLPDPPPPRPARRDAAIEAALRKFDGEEQIRPVRERGRLRSPGRVQRPGIAAFATFGLLAVVGIPATLIAIRDTPPPSADVPKPAVVHRETPEAPARQPSSPAADQLAQSPLPGTQPGSSVRRYSSADGGMTASADVEPSAVAPAARSPAAPSVAASPVIMAAPAPPPPPPPAAAPPAPERMAESGRSAIQNIIVTGSRVPAGPAESDAVELSPKVNPAHSRFLARLQGAVRSNNRRTIIALIQFPLRVNFKDGTRNYRDASSLERDFDKIFTPNVRNAIMSQQASQVFVRDQGAMIGDGQVWFDRTCRNSTCYPPGPVRIIAVNP